jgi:arylsulfatase A-like enzyme
MLLADDVGVDNIAVYAESATAPPTPNVDALAASGVLFRNAWATPHCSPTRASLLTGRYPSRHGVGIALCEGGSERCPVLPLREVTLPEVLDAQATGYAHALVGKWHLSDERNGAELGPNLAGWSHYAGILGAHPTSYFLWPRTVNGVTTSSTAYATTQVVDDALAWIQTAPEPWVCYVWFPAAHAPYHAPPAHLHSQNLAGLDPATAPVPFYKAMVEAMDTEIGRLLGSLGPALLGRTEVLILGDNGTPQEVSEPPFAPSHAKKTPFEGGVNVPLVVAGPSVGAPGREEAALVHAVDVFATVLELCGARP